MLYKSTKTNKTFNGAFYSYVDYYIVDSDVNCTMKVESAICEQVVIFLTYQKQKNIYICSTRKIYK